MNKISFLGDVFLDKPYKVDVSLDNFIFNLEYPITLYDVPENGKVNLKADKSYIESSFGNHPLAVTISNNHIFDFGQIGFEDTIACLEELDIPYFGGGLYQKFRSFKTKLGINEIGIIAYCCESTNAIYEVEGLEGGIERLVEKKIVEDITKLKKEVDFIILQLHWGQEEIPYPKPEDIEIAHKLIDSGVDLIIGHHAHVIQSIEKYKGKYIFYGLGNFIFPDLNLHANYDGKKFTSMYRKKQHSWNRKSIVVEVNEKLEVSYFMVKQNENTVTKTNELMQIDNSIDRLYEKSVEKTRREKRVKKLIEAPLYYLKKKISR